MPTPTKKRFQVALSFPGEYRPLVETVAMSLARELGRETVFYDRFFEAELARPNLDIYLQDIYRNKAALLVLFIGKDYEKKEWCQLESRAIRTLIKARRDEEIMPIRVDDGEVSGFFPIDGWAEAQGKSASQIAALIIQRLGLLRQETSSPPARRIETVTLAQPSTRPTGDGPLARAVRVTAQFKSCAPKLGIGFRLAPGRVLTCQHLIEHIDQTGTVETARKIEVSTGLDGSGGERVGAKSLWKGEARLDSDDPRALDAAILEDQLAVDDLEPFTHIVRLPQPRGKWEGAQPDRLAGAFDPVKTTATCLSLQWMSGPQAAESEQVPWAAISGAPVFVQGGRYPGWFYGIIRKRSGRLEGPLYAVATPALLRAPGFAAALGITDPPPPHERLVVECRRIFEEHPTLAAHLAACDPGWGAAWNAERNEGLLEAMCQEGGVRTLLEGLEGLAEVHRDEPALLPALHGSVVYLVALLAHHELVQRGGLDETSAGRFRVPLASPNYAEAVRAADEGRRPRYVHREGDLPGRELEVPKTRLESGIRPENKVADQFDELSARLVEHDLDAPDWLEPTLRDIAAAAPEAERLRRRAQAIDSKLRQIAKEKGGYPFLLLSTKNRSDFAHRLEGFLDHLGKLLPSLTYLELDGDAGEALDLEDQLRPLWNLLGIA